MEAAIVATDERQAQYQALVQQLLQTDAATVQPSHGEIEVLVLIDAHQASTMLLYLGWSGNVRHP